MNTVRTTKACLTLLEGGIVRIQVNDKAQLDEEDIREINRAKCSLVKGRRHTVLILSGTDTTITKEARELSAKEELAENRVAKAIVANSFAQALIGNFFIRVNRPPGPVMLFRDEAEALFWLSKFM